MMTYGFKKTKKKISSISCLTMKIILEQIGSCMGIAELKITAN
jgi:hypothetical protein